MTKGPSVSNPSPAGGVGARACRSFRGAAVPVPRTAAPPAGAGYPKHPDSQLGRLPAKGLSVSEGSRLRRSKLLMMDAATCRFNPASDAASQLRVESFREMAEQTCDSDRT